MRSELRLLAGLLRQRRHHRRGLTLIELLVALLLTAIVVGGTYMMFSSSSEIFHHQGLSAENQHNLRFAVEMLRRDVAHAGFNGTPNAAADPFVCPAPSFALAGLYIEPGVSLNLGGGAEPIVYDRIVVVGDSSLTGTLPVSAVTSSSITLQPGSLSADAFQAAFSPPRVVRLVNPDGLAQFSQVSSLDTSSLTINVEPSLREAAGGSCGYSPMAAANHEVNPLTGYMYWLREDPDEAGKSDLVRSQVSFDATGFVADDSTTVVMAEYVVDLEFLPLGVPAGSSPTAPTVSIESDEERAAMAAAGSTSVLDDSAIESRPQAARFVLFRIATRTRRAIPRRLFLSSSTLNADTAEKMFFDLGGNRLAEVRSLQGRIELPNFVLRNLR